MSHVQSIITTGLTGSLVTVECSLANGLPIMTIVGSAARPVAEAKDRLRSAFAASRLYFPKKRLTINLAPATLPKADTSLDLAIATSILLASQQLPLTLTGHEAFIGEIGLDGSLQPVRGIIGKLLAGRSAGIDSFYIPAQNLAQARLVPHVKLIPLTQLTTLAAYAQQPTPAGVVATGVGAKITAIIRPPLVDLAAIAGQALGKRALELAAAGGHNLLLHGPPGGGKSLLAQALPGLLPPLNREETLAVTQIYSLWEHRYGQVVSERPFRCPHHTIRLPALLGSSALALPGEISLAHHGVLLLDELPEFSRAAVEGLRQPLESHTINLHQAGHSLSYPANFCLVATANPCPCGFAGSNQPCHCSVYQIRQYNRKLSGPILDRIDLYAEVGPLEHQNLLLDSATTEPTATVQQRVARAREIQLQRLKKLNSQLTNEELRQHAHLTGPARQLLDTAASRLHLSARGYLRSLRLARTIADLAASATIETSHLAEALQFRPPAILGEMEQS